MRKLSRNDLCWCGSGKKYKKCHMASDMEKDQAQQSLYKTSPGVIVKTPEQIEGIRRSCALTKEVLDVVADRIREGITTNDINNWVHSYTIEHGGVPASLNYNGFPKSVCTSINEVICHGIPEDRHLVSGDIINVDVTSILDGYYGDASRMFCIGTVSEEAKKLVRVAKECMDFGIEKIQPMADIGEIGYIIERHAKANGFSVVRDYGGHGVGVRFHENPHVHHYGSRRRGVLLVPGMIFTVEPMINAGGYDTRLLDDDWTAVTADGSLSAQWEHTVLVTDNGYEILT